MHINIFKSELTLLSSAKRKTRHSTVNALGQYTASISTRKLLLQAPPYGSQWKDLKNPNNHYLIAVWRNTAKIIFCKGLPAQTLQNTKTGVHEELGQHKWLFTPINLRYKKLSL